MKGRESLTEKGVEARLSTDRMGSEVPSLSTKKPKFNTFKHREPPAIMRKQKEEMFRKEWLSKVTPYSLLIEKSNKYAGHD